jgi:hypothetical protein
MGDGLQDQDVAERQERQPPTHSKYAVHYIVNMLHQEIDPYKVIF